MTFFMALPPFWTNSTGNWYLLWIDQFCFTTNWVPSGVYWVFRIFWFYKALQLLICYSFQKQLTLRIYGSFSLNISFFLCSSDKRMQRQDQPSSGRAPLLQNLWSHVFMVGCQKICTYNVFPLTLYILVTLLCLLWQWRSRQNAA